MFIASLAAVGLGAAQGRPWLLAAGLAAAAVPGAAEVARGGRAFRRR